ncbi:hypothetical protein CVT24_012215 [Panaeolus cyanescens]|uniref:Uncharacterized protein n=1 Tax=Panaeolus cyanescens TaxID=181874 RepID=A0A409YIS4_9AGAR|nr:hypothetical protein CVT24_012215 [Panaeolus cyanescens]
MEPIYVFPSDEETRTGLTAAANAPISSHPLLRGNDNVDNDGPMYVPMYYYGNVNAQGQSQTAFGRQQWYTCGVNPNWFHPGLQPFIAHHEVQNQHKPRVYNGRVSEPYALPSAHEPDTTGNSRIPEVTPCASTPGQTMTSTTPHKANTASSAPISAHRYRLRSKFKGSTAPVPFADDSDAPPVCADNEPDPDSFESDQEPDADDLPTASGSGNVYIRCEWPRTDGKPCRKMLWVRLPPKGTRRLEAKDRQAAPNVYKHLLACKYHEDVTLETWKVRCRFGPECQGLSGGRQGGMMNAKGIGRHVTNTVSHLHRWIKYDKEVERDEGGRPTGNIGFTKVPLNFDDVDSDDEELLQKHGAAEDVLFRNV